MSFSHHRDVRIILHNVRSAHNVGSIFRTADAAGVSRIYLTGYTPTPKDRFGRSSSAISKTALGAEKTVPWKHARSLSTLLKTLRHERRALIAVEQARGAAPYTKLTPRKHIVFLFGNEVRGLSSRALQQTDEVIDIPMLGKKESLNVAVAAGIILFSYRALSSPPATANTNR